MSIPVNDIQKLRRFVVSNVDPSEVDKLGKEGPVDLLIRAVYGKVECEELEKNKMKFDENFIRFYTYLIIAIHRILFEQQGKCAKQLLDIANYLNPHTSDFSILLEFYGKIHKIIEKGEIKREKELQSIYHEFKDYFGDSFRALIAPKVIKATLVYLGMKDIDVSDINFEDESYVHYNDIDVPLEEMIEKFGLVDIGIEDEETLLNFYKKWFSEKSKKSRRNLFKEYILKNIKKDP